MQSEEKGQALNENLKYEEMCILVLSIKQLRKTSTEEKKEK